jgi:hypothetical protein
MTKKIAAACVSLTVLGLSALGAVVAGTCLTEYGLVPVHGWTVLGGGVVVAALLWLLLTRRGVRTGLVVTIAAVLLLLVAAPALSMIWPGRITHARFGLTVYGIVPVPALDVVVTGSGWLRFRDKTHLVTLDEVTPLLDDEVTDVVIGTGWQGAVTVPDEVRSLPGVTVHVLTTPRAFELFNRLKDEGRRVVLVSHSTC